VVCCPQLALVRGEPAELPPRQGPQTREQCTTGHGHLIVSCYTTNSPEETTALGRGLARDTRPPCLVVLEGELGSGKTTLVKGIVAGLGAGPEEEVHSPSFALVHEYGHERKVYHVDLYRVEGGARELGTLGLGELVDQEATVLVEWGEKLGDLGLVPQVRIRLEHLEGDARRITVERLDDTMLA